MPLHEWLFERHRPWKVGVLMPLLRLPDGSFERAGKYRKVYEGDLSAGTKPAWLSERPGSGGISYDAAGSPGVPGKAVFTLAAGAGTTPGGWDGPVVDLANERIRALWWTVDDVSFVRGSSGVYFSAELGIRSIGSAVAGASFLTNFGPPNYPIMRCLSGGAAVGADEVRFPWGPRVFESATTPLKLGDNPRPMTLHIDNRDKTVSLLMGDQVAYSRKLSALVRGSVQPTLNMGKTGSDTTQRQMVVEGAFRYVVEYD